MFLAFSNPGDRLGAALQQPDMIANVAVWDSCAVPALCLLALGSSHASEHTRLYPQLTARAHGAPQVRAASRLQIPK